MTVRRRVAKYAVPPRLQLLLDVLQHDALARRSWRYISVRYLSRHRNGDLLDDNRLLLWVDVLIASLLVRLFIVALHDVDRIVNPLLPQVEICHGSCAPEHLSWLLPWQLKLVITDVVFLLVWRRRVLEDV